MFSSSIALCATLAFASTAIASPVAARSASKDLTEFTLEKVLQDAAPVFGDYVIKGESKTATWMKRYHDSTLIIDMNLPGAHDVSSWTF
jgi:1-phosphatidylinositol phosphodiesterase